MRRASLITTPLLLVLALQLSACTHQQALVVTGETLGVLGEQFVATGAAMNTALDNKTITPEAYRKWAAFGRKFKVAYPLAVGLWKAAEEAKDERLIAQAGAVVAQLGAELGAWAALVGGR